MLTDLLRINTSRITGLPKKKKIQGKVSYEVNLRVYHEFALSFTHTITEASRQSLMS